VDLRTGIAAARSDRHKAIRDAVFDLLTEVGYDRMSMDAVATRARASKATIYRAWPNKRHLVTAALVHHFRDAPDVPNTGSLRGDLIALVTAACTVATGSGGSVVTGLMSAASRNPKLSRTMQQLLYEIKHPVYLAILSAAKARGDVPADTSADLLHEVLHAMVLSKLLWAPSSLDDDFVVLVVDDVLLPVLTKGA
jgi:AcrR family transcriptional regulator